MTKRKSKIGLLSRLEAMPDKDEKRGTSWEEEQLRAACQCLDGVTRLAEEVCTVQGALT